MTIKTNDNGTRLLSLSEECRLFIINSFYHSKTIHRHTWYSPTGFTKRVYYILAEWHLKKLSSNCRVYRKATVPFETNHRLLAMTCSFLSKRNRKAFFSKASKPSKPYKDISSLRYDPVICNKFSEKMDDFSQSRLFKTVNPRSQKFSNRLINVLGQVTNFCLF